jgi:cell division protein ZapA
MADQESNPHAAESVRVSIFNRTYSLRSTSGGEHIRRVALLVDERMRLIASQLAVHDVSKIAVLTALNLADELEGLKDFYEKELRALLTRAHEADEKAEQNPVVEEPEPLETNPVETKQSWFDAIFDTEAPAAKTGVDRLSSQVSSRLQRLRQPAPESSITEDPGGERNAGGDGWPSRRNPDRHGDPTARGGGEN